MLFGWILGFGVANLDLAGIPLGFYLVTWGFVAMLGGTVLSLILERKKIIKPRTY
jgi:hypothetical protein